MRKSLLGAAALAALLLPGSALAQSGTIKIGILVALEGAFATGGAGWCPQCRTGSQASQQHHRRQEDRNRRCSDGYQTRHDGPHGSQARGAGQRRLHHRPAFRLGRHCHARFRQDHPRQGRDQRHFRRARDDLGRSRAELLPLQPRRLAMGLRPRQLRREDEGLEARGDDRSRLFVRLHQLHGLRGGLLQIGRRHRPALLAAARPVGFRRDHRAAAGQCGCDLSGPGRNGCDQLPQPVSAGR